MSNLSNTIYEDYDLQNLLKAMCLGNIRTKITTKRGANGMHDVDNPHDYSHIFTGIETQMIHHRALMMQRLVKDPFYNLMNINPPARKWMLRHLPNLAEVVDQRYQINLMQFFKLLGRDEILKFFRFKNAPADMVELWKKMIPAPVQIEEFKFKEPMPKDGGNPAKRRRI